MKNFKEDNKKNELKKLDNINLSGWVYQGGWNYFGEVEQNGEKPSGFGRAITIDNSKFIDCYFRNGECHGEVRFIMDDGTYNIIDFEEGKKHGK